jgi:hypothetical protein
MRQIKWEPGESEEFEPYEGDGESLEGSLPDASEGGSSSDPDKLDVGDGE